jgi:hypothetical protein
MLHYPARSAPALGFLRRSANDIDIYVEDAARSDVWLAILRVCLPRKVKLRHVNPLGDRTSVLAACRADQEDTRPRLYIIDGDFDYLLGKGIPRVKNLYRMPATNLEAFVLMTAGLVPLMAKMLPAESVEDIQNDIKLNLQDPWFSHLVRLFAFYAENERTRSGVQTCSFHVERLRIAGATPWQPDLRIIIQRAKMIAQTCKQSIGLGNTKLREIRSRASQLPVEKVISGKTYLWPLYQQHFRRRVAASLNAEQLMLLIIAHGVCPSDSLRRRLRAQCKAI